MPELPNDSQPWFPPAGFDRGLLDTSENKSKE